jgi:hypothetical protein
MGSKKYKKNIKRSPEPKSGIQDFGCEISSFESRGSTVDVSKHHFPACMSLSNGANCNSNPPQL